MRWFSARNSRIRCLHCILAHEQGNLGDWCNEFAQQLCLGCHGIRQLLSQVVPVEIQQTLAGALVLQAFGKDLAPLGLFP
jgi:hypothetical protein